MLYQHFLENHVAQLVVQQFFVDLENLIYWIVISSLWNFNDWLSITWLNLKGVVNDNQSIT